MGLRFGKGRRTQRICSFRGSYANRGNGMEQSSSDAVPVTGLEPVRDLSQGILSPRCLPFHHTGLGINKTIICSCTCQEEAYSRRPGAYDRGEAMP